MNGFPRPLKWRDLPLLYRYRRQAISLRAVRRAIGGPGLLSLASIALISPTGGVWGAVDKEARGHLVALAEANADNALAEMAFLAPQDSLAQANLKPLVESLASAPAFRGMRALTAEAPIDAEWFTSLQKAGFKVVERRQVWELAKRSENPSGEARWHYPSPQGRWEAERLYHNLTPPLVRLARPNPAISPTALVYLENGEVRGLARWATAGRRIWVEPLLDPDIRDPKQAFTALSAALPAGTLLLSIPDSRAWLADALAALGAQMGEVYASLVRWSASAVKAEEPLTSAAAVGVNSDHAKAIFHSDTNSA